MSNLQVEIPESLHERIQSLAAGSGVSVDEYVANAIAEKAGVSGKVEPAPAIPAPEVKKEKFKQPSRKYTPPPDKSQENPREIWPYILGGASIGMMVSGGWSYFLLTEPTGTDNGGYVGALLLVIVLGVAVLLSTLIGAVLGWLIGWMLQPSADSQP